MDCVVELFGSEVYFISAPPDFILYYTGRYSPVDEPVDGLVPRVQGNFPDRSITNPSALSDIKGSFISVCIAFTFFIIITYCS